MRRFCCYATSCNPMFHTACSLSIYEWFSITTPTPGVKNALFTARKPLLQHTARSCSSCHRRCLAGGRTARSRAQSSQWSDVARKPAGRGHATYLLGGGLPAESVVVGGDLISQQRSNTLICALFGHELRCDWSIIRSRHVDNDHTWIVPNLRKIRKDIL